MQTSRTTSRSPISPPPPLLFVLVWNCFVVVHAFFMLSAVWRGGGSSLFALIAFYAAFFAAGFWMARGYFLWWRFKRRFGTPELAGRCALAPIEIGENAHFALQFDRVWPDDARLTASLNWLAFDHDGDVCATHQLQQLHGNQHAENSCTVWQASAIVSAPPASTTPLVLALDLHADGAAKL